MIRLTEDINSVKKQYSYIPEDEFDKIIRIDPTFREGSNSVGKYGKWLLSIYNHPIGGKTEKDYYADGYYRDKLSQRIAQYDKMKNDRKYNIEKDIMKFKNHADMGAAIQNATEVELSDRQASRERKKQKEYELVFEGDTYMVFTPFSHAGNMALASFGNSEKANWCTAADSENGIAQWNDHIKKGTIYVLINKNDYEDKYQFHFETRQFNNADQSKKHQLANVLARDSKLIEFFKSEGKEVPTINDDGLVIDTDNYICDSIGGDQEEIVIPDGINGVCERNVFNKYKNLKSIILPETCQFICDEAFMNCINLEYIKFPEQLACISRNCFAYCKNLKSIDMGHNIEYISQGAFLGCDSLEEVKIPNGCAWIEENAFRNCDSLKRIYVPDSINDIETFALFANRDVVVYTNNPKVVDYCYDECIDYEDLPQGIYESYRRIKMKEN